ncbi:hypothetical protein GCM10023063_15200 [Arthrobacter methylotrophus]|uniref:Uncharacterized protein n=2 Tax=Arthrobacter methylotrophus TaxID=121291 RepID=A0ABV5UN51_9MICC
MVNTKQPPAWDDPLYQDIRHLAGDLAYVCDEVIFEPLHGRHTKVLSVNGVIPGFGNPEVNLTLWEGYRDGTGKDGSEHGWWIQNGGADPVPLNVDAPGEGLDYPEDLEDKVSVAVPVLHRLMMLASKAHAGLVGLARSRSFRQLNDAVDVGMSAARADSGGSYEEDEEFSTIERLQEMCAESVFEFIDFTSLPPNTDDLATSATLLIGDVPVSMSVWSGHDRGSEVTYLELGGRTQRLPRAGTDDPAVQWPDEDGEVNDLLAAACDELLGIHRAAEAVFGEATAGDRDTIRLLMSAAAQAPVDDGMDVEGPLPDVGAAWHEQLQEFTRQCRLGLLVGVVVDESPQGPGLNVRAQTLDPVTNKPVRLQVFWKAPEHPEDEPVHWLATDLAESPAHGGDPLHPELLAGFPQDSRLHIRHAIDHLHDIADLATDVVVAREMEMSAMLERTGLTGGDVPELVAGEMLVESVEDALAALNGIARLYTGSTDREIRNS